MKCYECASKQLRCSVIFRKNQESASIPRTNSLILLLLQLQYSEQEWNLGTMELQSRRKILRFSVLVLVVLFFIGSASARHIKKEGRTKEKHHRQKTGHKLRHKVKCDDQCKTRLKRGQLAKGKRVIFHIKFDDFCGL